MQLISKECRFAAGFCTMKSQAPRATIAICGTLASRLSGEIFWDSIWVYFESIYQSNELLPWDHDIATESVTLSICGEEHTTSSWHSDISFTVRIIEGGHFWWGHHRLWREEPSAAVLGESSRFRQVVTTLRSLKIQTLLNWGRLEQVAKMGGAPADNFQTVGDRCW